ncbi:hypothetical protein [Sedimentitalea nanhaiensis]|uniref:Uncharacterized protein n=1 Tax=Sedimentitalea nanhaiensis TaxID=999627 RepID=A0A1I7D1Y5_9RHOB|nr:hypothetical protein [Sedimentitalea nanhaiensis]SFU05728.1 hypothetical protein SAMN05216236_1226 [Sedimentitalea nanhaiensis]
MKARWLGLLVGFAAQMAQAQYVDPMEQQRCIWRCLAGSPGNTSPQYHQCVARFCTPQTAPQYSAPSFARHWKSGIAADGQTRFAGADVGQEGGPGLYYMCDRQGQSYLMLFRHQGPPGMMRFRIGAQDFTVPFDRSRGELTVNVTPGGRFLNALSYGQSVWISDMHGGHVMHLNLQGAAAALQGAMAGCRG